MVVQRWNNFCYNEEVAWVQGTWYKGWEPRADPRSDGGAALRERRLGRAVATASLLRTGTWKTTRHSAVTVHRGPAVSAIPSAASLLRPEHGREPLARLYLSTLLGDRQDRFFSRPASEPPALPERSCAARAPEQGRRALLPRAGIAIQTWARRLMPLVGASPPGLPASSRADRSGGPLPSVAAPPGPGYKSTTLGVGFPSEQGLTL